MLARGGGRGVERDVSGNFGQRRRAGDQHRRSARHGLDNRQAKSFVTRRKPDCRGGGVQGPEAIVRDKSKLANAVADARGLERKFRIGMIDDGQQKIRMKAMKEGPGF
jgi:hypothetical protein